MAGVGRWQLFSGFFQRRDVRRRGWAAHARLAESVGAGYFVAFPVCGDVLGGGPPAGGTGAVAGLWFELFQPGEASGFRSSQQLGGMIVEGDFAFVQAGSPFHR